MPVQLAPMERWRLIGSSKTVTLVTLRPGQRLDYSLQINNLPRECELFDAVSRSLVDGITTGGTRDAAMEALRAVNSLVPSRMRVSGSSIETVWTQ